MMICPLCKKRTRMLETLRQEKEAAQVRVAELEAELEKVNRELGVALKGVDAWEATMISEAEKRADFAEKRVKEMEEKVNIATRWVNGESEYRRRAELAETRLKERNETIAAQDLHRKDIEDRAASAEKSLAECNKQNLAHEANYLMERDKAQAAEQSLAASVADAKRLREAGKEVLRFWNRGDIGPQREAGKPWSEEAARAIDAFVNSLVKEPGGIMPDKDGNITIHDVQVACGHICGGCETLRQENAALQAEVRGLKDYIKTITTVCTCGQPGTTSCPGCDEEYKIRQLLSRSQSSYAREAEAKEKVIEAADKLVNSIESDEEGEGRYDIGYLNLLVKALAGLERARSER